MTYVFTSNYSILRIIRTGLAGFEPANAGVKVLCLNRLAIAQYIHEKIRTFGTFRYNALAGHHFKPLSHMNITQSLGLEPRLMILETIVLPFKLTLYKVGGVGVEPTMFLRHGFTARCNRHYAHPPKCQNFITTVGYL